MYDILYILSGPSLIVYYHYYGVVRWIFSGNSNGRSLCYFRCDILPRLCTEPHFLSANFFSAEVTPVAGLTHRCMTSNVADNAITRSADHFRHRYQTSDIRHRYQTSDIRHRYQTSDIRHRYQTSDAISRSLRYYCRTLPNTTVKPLPNSPITESQVVDLYYTILYYTILYYTILYYTILYYTIL